MAHSRRGCPSGAFPPLGCGGCSRTARGQGHRCALLPRPRAPMAGMQSRRPPQRRPSGFGYVRTPRTLGRSGPRKKSEKDARTSLSDRLCLHKAGRAVKRDRPHARGPARGGRELVCKPAASILYWFWRNYFGGRGVPRAAERSGAGGVRFGVVARTTTAARWRHSPRAACAANAAHCEFWARARLQHCMSTRARYGRAVRTRARLA